MRLEAHLILALAIGAVIALMLAAMVLKSRPLIAEALLGDAPAEASPLRIRVARGRRPGTCRIRRARWGCHAQGSSNPGINSISPALVVALKLLVFPVDAVHSTRQPEVGQLRERTASGS